MSEIRNQDDRLDVTIATIAKDFGKSPRTVHNWNARQILPPHDAVFMGVRRWKRSTYNTWLERVLRDEFAGVSKIANVGMRPSSAAAPARPKQARRPSRTKRNAAA